MKIIQVKVQNFRSIKDETLLFDDLTILAGANGSGKSYQFAIEITQV